MSTPTTTAPAPGKTLSVRVDEMMHEDLGVLIRSGMNASEAARYCVNIVARAYVQAWERGFTPEGEVPDLIMGVQRQS